MTATWRSHSGKAAYLDRVGRHEEAVVERQKMRHAKAAEELKAIVGSLTREQRRDLARLALKGGDSDALG